MRSLALKLTLFTLGVSLAGILVVAVLARQTTADEFGNFMFDQNQSELITQLQAHHRARGSWEGVEALLAPAGQGGMPMHGMMMGGLVLADASGQVVYAGRGYKRGQPLTRADLEAGLPVTVDGQLVGTLLIRRETQRSPISPAGTAFLTRVNRALTYGALATGALALLFSLVLARALTRPIQELIAATRQVAGGHLGQTVPVRSQDELGELAGAFNQMSADLARARDLRQQMTADIAHDLRTPLSVILGHAEALRDGVLPPTPETFSLIHAEAQRLNRLVEDLRTLSLAEAGELPLVRRPAAPGALLQRAAEAMQARAQAAQVELRLSSTSGLPEVEVDSDRMAQVLGNLLDNALRYTPAGGTIRLEASRGPTRVRLSVQDSGPGIATQDLPRIFERFYRADRARARDQGGSGLGLAIARSIVASHGGQLWAENAPEGGARFVIDL